MRYLFKSQKIYIYTPSLCERFSPLIPAGPGIPVLISLPPFGHKFSQLQF